MHIFRTLLLLVSLTLLVGCGNALTGMRTALSAVGEMQVKGQQAAESAYQAEQEACAPSPAGDPCVTNVRAEWVPVKKAAVQLYTAYTVALATYQAASATYAALGTFDPKAIADALAQLLQAAETWRSAIATHGGTVLAAAATAPLLPSSATPSAAPSPSASVLPAPATLP